jgi:hypothetical protein
MLKTRVNHFEEASAFDQVFVPGLLQSFAPKLRVATSHAIISVGAVVVSNQIVSITLRHYAASGRLVWDDVPVVLVAGVVTAIPSGTVLGQEVEVLVSNALAVNATITAYLSAK